MTEKMSQGSAVEFFHTRSNRTVFHVLTVSGFDTGPRTYEHAACSRSIQPAEDAPKISEDGIPEFASPCHRCLKKVNWITV